VGENDCLIIQFVLLCKKHVRNAKQFLTVTLSLKLSHVGVQNYLEFHRWVMLIVFVPAALKSVLRS